MILLQELIDLARKDKLILDFIPLLFHVKCFKGLDGSYEIKMFDWLPSIPATTPCNTYPCCSIVCKHKVGPDSDRSDTVALILAELWVSAPPEENRSRRSENSPTNYDREMSKWNSSYSFQKPEKKVQKWATVHNPAALVHNGGNFVALTTIFLKLV